MSWHLLQKLCLYSSYRTHMLIRLCAIISTTCTNTPETIVNKTYYMCVDESDPDMWPYLIKLPELASKITPSFRHSASLHDTHTCNKRSYSSHVRQSDASHRPTSDKVNDWHGAELNEWTAAMSITSYHRRPLNSIDVWYWHRPSYVLPHPHVEVQPLSLYTVSYVWNLTNAEVCICADWLLSIDNLRNLSYPQNTTFRKLARRAPGPTKPSWPQFS